MLSSYLLRMIPKLLVRLGKEKTTLKMKLRSSTMTSKLMIRLERTVKALILRIRIKGVVWALMKTDLMIKTHDLPSCRKRLTSPKRGKMRQNLTSKLVTLLNASLS